MCFPTTARARARAHMDAHAHAHTPNLPRVCPWQLPFDEIIYANIGNPQSLGQKPFQFTREVLALVMDPSKLDSPAAGELYAADAAARARHYLAHMPGNSAGAYTESKGLAVFRKEIAAFIEERDGYPADFEDIFMTDGASAGQVCIPPPPPHQDLAADGRLRCCRALLTCVLFSLELFCTRNAHTPQ